MYAIKVLKAVFLYKPRHASIVFHCSPVADVDVDAESVFDGDEE